MDKPEPLKVVCCSQCPHGNCPDCPVAEAERNKKWWRRLASKMGFLTEGKSEKETAETEDLK